MNPFPKEFSGLIKTDEESQKKFRKLEKSGKQRLLIMVAILAMAVSLSVIFVGLSIYKMNAFKSQVQQLEDQVEQCK